MFSTRQAHRFANHAVMKSLKTVCRPKDNEMSLRDNLKKLLLECIEEYAEMSEEEVVIEEDSRLLGSSGMLDSLGLVTILTSFEAEINETLDLDIILANEQAMSMKNSPFRTPNTLIDYAVVLVQKEQAA
jgi:acyl carrier protein